MTRTRTTRTLAAVATVAAFGATLSVPSLLAAAAPDEPSVADSTTTIAPLHHGEPHRDHGGLNGGGRAFEVLTDVLGMDDETLRAELAAGASLTDVATGRGMTSDALLDALVSDLAAHVGQQVAAGRLTPGKADALVADAAARFADRLDDVPAFGGSPLDSRPSESRRPGRGPAPEVLDLLGVDAETLRAQLDAGVSLDELARDNGVDVQAVLDAMEDSRHPRRPGGDRTAKRATGRVIELDSRAEQSLPAALRPGLHQSVPGATSRSA